MTDTRCDTKITLITPHCQLCGKNAGVKVPIEGFFAWQRGMLLQDAMPELSVELREQIISGTHPACWDKLFPVACSTCNDWDNVAPEDRQPRCPECEQEWA